MMITNGKSIDSAAGVSTAAATAGAIAPQLHRHASATVVSVAAATSAPAGDTVAVNQLLQRAETIECIVVGDDGQRMPADIDPCKLFFFILLPLFLLLLLPSWLLSANVKKLYHLTSTLNCVVNFACFSVFDPQNSDQANMLSFLRCLKARLFPWRHERNSQRSSNISPRCLRIFLPRVSAKPRRAVCFYPAYN